MGRIAVAAIVTLWVVPISILVNRILPDSYMILRSINGILAVLCSVLVYEIISHLRPNLDEKRATIYAVILALYPLHWFFTFLYYTDVASLTAVLAMYLACLKKNYWLSALFGIFAVVIRQTNVIWMLFVACSGVIDTTMTFHDDNIQMHENDVVEESSSLIAKGSLNSKANLRKRKFSRTKDVGKQVPQSTRFSSINQKLGLMNEIRAMILTMWRMKFQLLVSFFPFVVVLMAFVAFVRWNGSIVLGAKEAHTVSLHFAQIMYFGLFSALLMAPMHCNPSQVIDLFHSFWKGRPLSFFQVFIALLAGFISVQYFSCQRTLVIKVPSRSSIYLFVVFHHQDTRGIPEKNLGSGLFLSHSCGSCSCSFDRV